MKVNLLNGKGDKMKKRILKLIMKKLGVKEQEHFQFADQREEFIEYFFTLEALMRFNPETNEIKESRITLNYLLSDDCKIIRVREWVKYKCQK